MKIEDTQIKVGHSLRHLKSISFYERKVLMNLNGSQGVQ